MTFHTFLGIDFTPRLWLPRPEPRESNAELKLSDALMDLSTLQLGLQLVRVESMRASLSSRLSQSSPGLLKDDNTGVVDPITSFVAFADAGLAQKSQGRRHGDV